MFGRGQLDLEGPIGCECEVVERDEGDRVAALYPGDTGLVVLVLPTTACRDRRGERFVWTGEV